MQTMCFGTGRYSGQWPKDAQTREILDFNKKIKRTNVLKTSFSLFVMVLILSESSRDKLDIHVIVPFVEIEVAASPFDLSTLEIYGFTSRIDLCG